MTPKELPQPLAVGESVPYLSNLIIAEIIPIPSDSKERKKLFNQLRQRLLTDTSLQFLKGDNLADVEELAPRVNKKAWYLFRK